MRNASDELRKMVQQYAETLLWQGLAYTSEDEEPRPMDEDYSLEDIAPEALREIEQDCRHFLAECSADLAGIDAEQAGHDFCLTRNHHGAGFWDRGLGEVGERLTRAAQVYGESGEYVGADGRIYV